VSGLHADDWLEIRAHVRLPNGHRLPVGIADTALTRARGLMFRDTLAPVAGLLIVFEQAARHAIWMRHVRLPLDAAWLDDSGRIVHLEAALPPCAARPCPTWAPAEPALYVLETEAGVLADCRVGGVVEIRVMKNEE
jgi:hypothetical protein